MPLSAPSSGASSARVPPPEPRGYPGNLGHLFAAHAGSTRSAIVDLYDPAQPQAVSYQELDRLCNAVARGLARAGLKPGDRVAILALNRIEFVAVFFGSMRAGVVPVPVNIKLAADTIRYILEDSGAKAVFAERAFKSLVASTARVIWFEKRPQANCAGKIPHADAFTNFIDPGSFTAFEPLPDSVAVQPYTSGSTGRPKGVLLTHYGQNWSRRVLAWSRATTPRDVILVAAPMYHKNALNALKQGLTAGAMLPLLPQFTAERYLDAIGRYRCTVVSGVPTMLSMVLKQKQALATTDVSSVRTVMMGSAPASRTLLDELKRTFPNAEPLVVYGVTEAGPVPLGPHPSGKPRPLGSIGAEYAGTQAKLATGAAATEGELMVKNPGVLLGYHNLPDETARRIRDGWYYTGDICRRDADGFFYFVGRNDDMFVCGGENIFPIEVEALLERHPAVHQALVLPFAHELKGQVPYAFVVLRQSAQASEEDLKSFALANGPAYQHPRRIFFLDAFPLAGTNKIDPQQLRRWAAEQTREQHDPSPTLHRKAHG